MPYLGNLPAERFTSFDKQTITGNGGTSYTLDHPVGNEQEIEVFVNNVRQEPSVAYTVAGTALTMTGNVESSDDFYVVFQGKATQTATHPETFDLKAVNGTFSGDVTAVDGTFTGDVTSDGSLGIGTTSPSFLITSDFNAPATWGNAAGNFAQMWQNSGTNALGVAVGDDSKVSLTTNNGYDLLFAHSGTEKFRMTSNGLTFNGDTAAANALDDYEEGTWTPTADRATTSFTTAPTYTNRDGRYTKIGNTVIASFNIRFASNPSGGSGSPIVTGFPFSIHTSTLPGVAIGLHTAVTSADNVYADATERIVFGSASYTSDPNYDYMTGTVVYQTD